MFNFFKIIILFIYFPFCVFAQNSKISYDDLIFKADVSYIDREYEESLKYIDGAFNFKPKDWYLFLRRADLKHKLNKYNDALKDVDQAIEINPNNYDIYLFKASINMKLQKYQDVYNNALKALELNKNSADAYYYIALSIFDIKDFGHDSKPCEYVYKAGVLYIKNNNLSDAEKCLEILKKIYSKSKFISNLITEIVQYSINNKIKQEDDLLLKKYNMEYNSATKTTTIYSGKKMSAQDYSKTLSGIFSQLESMQKINHQCEMNKSIHLIDRNANR